MILIEIGNCLPDLYTTVMMHIFNMIWTTMPIDKQYQPYIETYTVLPLGYFQKTLYGGIECVPSISLEDFDWYFSSLLSHKKKCFIILI